MNNNFVSNYFPAWKFLPEDVKNQIFTYKDMMKTNFVNTDCRNEFIHNLQSETDQKIGVFQKNLMLEGIFIVREIVDLKKCKGMRKVYEAYCKGTDFGKVIFFSGYDNWDGDEKNFGKVWDLYCNALDAKGEGRISKSRMTLKALALTSNRAFEAENALKKIDEDGAKVFIKPKKSNLRQL